MVVPLDVSRTKSVKALEEAMTAQHLVFVVSQKQAETEDPQEKDLFAIGTTAKILELLKMHLALMRGKLITFALD